MSVDRLLLESGDFLLLETSDKLLLESSSGVTTVEADGTLTGAGRLSGEGDITLVTADCSMRGAGSLQGDFQIKRPGVGWLVIAKVFLDSGTMYHAAGVVRHPSWTYTGRVLSWGFVDRSIPEPVGLPQVSDAQIRIADTDRTLRDLLSTQTPRRRHVELKMVQEGGSESKAAVVYKGQIVDFRVIPGAIELTLRDRTFAWLDEEIPSIINRTNFPELDPGSDGAFFPIINGNCVSPAANPQGVVKLPHIGFTPGQDRYALACHPCWDVVAIYRQEPTDGEFVVVDPGEYNVTVVARTIENVAYHLTFIDFLVEQVAGSEIRADVQGIYFRGSWNGYDPVGYDPVDNPSGTPGTIRNPIDFFINMTFLVLQKAGLVTDFDAGQIMVVRQLFEDLGFLCDGAITESMTCREFLARFLASFELDMYQTKAGKITLSYTAATDAGRPQFTEGRHVLKNSFLEGIANPTINRVRYMFARNYATEEWASQDIEDNEDDQDALDHIEEDTLELWFIRDASLAQTIVLKRMAYLAIGSYRQQFTMPAPEVMDSLELARLIGITHRDGLDYGGYDNKEVKVVGMTIDLDRLTVSLRTILRIPQTVDQHTVVAADASVTGAGSVLGNGTVSDAIGCQSVWPGYFYDSWNYAATMSGTQTTFGAYWRIIPPSGADATLTTSGGGFNAVSSHNRLIAYVSCASLPALPDQYAMTSWNSSDFAFNTDSGGPAVFVKENPSAGIDYWGYCVRLLNKQTFDHSVDTFGRLTLEKLEKIGASVFDVSLASYAFTYDTGSLVNGPMEVGHGLRLEGYQEGANIRLKVYLDDILRINYLDSSSPFTFGAPGFVTGGNVQLGTFRCGPAPY